MFGKRRRDTQADVASRADFEGNLALAQFGHQPRVFQATHAVADALSLQYSQRSPDALCPGGLARVRNGREPGGARAVESLLEEFRRISGFYSAQPERYYAALHPADRPIGHRQSMFDRTHVADDVENPADADSQLSRRPLSRPSERGDLVFKQDAPV